MVVGIHEISPCRRRLPEKEAAGVLFGRNGGRRWGITGDLSPWLLLDPEVESERSEQRSGGGLPSDHREEDREEDPVKISGRVDVKGKDLVDGGPSLGFRML